MKASENIASKKCYLLKVKRKCPEKAHDSLILEKLGGIRGKRLRVSSPEEYLREKIEFLGLNKGPMLDASLLFQRIESLNEESKKAVMVEEDSECLLFELPVKKQKRKEKWANGISVSTKFSLKEKALKEQELNSKRQRDRLIGMNRSTRLFNLKEGTTTNNAIEERKETDAKTDILYCDEQLMTLEFTLPIIL
eukprot:TRINITY_DN19104_c0_g1_i1.p1 TRINITY_DN19104_c0_g1~~TRINITY_DN19104_c0_g1_i1.p1  ORF type:complete len:194 (-),score=29.58 TRINITY_DN19104_c0_g1_i1:345-926(-)